MKPPVRAVRRRPTQSRALETVTAILDAVPLILRRDGAIGLTTNHIAAVAGVSIGSLYQYFRDKHAIFVALHQRHVERVDHAIRAQLVEQSGSSLETLMRSLMEAMFGAHAEGSELYEFLLDVVPHRAGGTNDFSTRLHQDFLRALSSRTSEMRHDRNLEKAAFTTTHMLDSLCHGALFGRPETVSLPDAKSEVLQALTAYLRGD